MVFHVPLSHGLQSTISAIANTGMVCICSPAVYIPTLGLLGLVCQLVTLVLLALLSTRVCWHYLREAIQAGFFCHATNLSEPKIKLSSVAPLCEASKYTCHGRVVKTPRNDELMSISKNANVLFSQNEFIEVNPNLVLVIMLVCCS